MASYDVIAHEISSLQHSIPQTLHPIPSDLIQIVLTIEVSHHTPITDVPFLRTVSFPFVLVTNLDHFDDFLYTTLQSLGIYTESPDHGMIVHQIMQRALDMVRAYTYRCERLYLELAVLVVPRIDQRTLMTRALDMSRSDFESNNYGMVAATPSSVKDMIKRMTVEDDGKQNCVVCLEELEVGLEASRMPCSHIFHSDCIETWLKQAHSCPICRYKMPTVTDYTDK